MNPDLIASYSRCRALLAEHGRSYYLATKLLPAYSRPAVWALYGFARYVDDLVDVEISAAPSVDFIDQIDAEFQAAIAAGESTHPIYTATVDTVLRHEIDPQWIADFLSSMRMDLTPHSYATWDDLRTYTWGSASVIGLQMTQVIGTKGDKAQAHRRAALLGEAFQLTNFCRDYDEDRERGRVYLPTELFERAGIEPGSTEPNGVREVIRSASAHARALYREAEPGIALLNDLGQPCISAAFSLYEGILDEIEGANFDVLGQRHRLSQARRLTIAAPLAASSLWRRATSTPHRQH